MRKFLSIACIAATGLLFGCGEHVPLDEAPPPAAGEFEEGPGVFSGSDGGFYIVGGDRKKRKY